MFSPELLEDVAEEDPAALQGSAKGSHAADQPPPTSSVEALEEIAKQRALQRDRERMQADIRKGISGKSVRVELGQVDQVDGRQLETRNQALVQSDLLDRYERDHLRYES